LRRSDSINILSDIKSYERYYSLNIAADIDSGYLCFDEQKICGVTLKYRIIQDEYSHSRTEKFLPLKERKILIDSSCIKYLNIRETS
jgi:hypothetical protein